MKPRDELARLLDAERAVAPPVDAIELGLERLLGSLVAQVAPLPIAVTTLKAGWSLVAKFVGVGVVVGLAGAGAASYAFTPTSSPAAAPAPFRAVPTALPRVVAPAEASAVPASPRSALPAQLRPSPARTQPPEPAPQAPASSSPTFDEELQLIATAKRELDAGRPHLAQVWLDQHRARFPGGVFSVEREGLSLLAACSARPDPGRARAFAAAQLGSPMVEQVLRKCEATGASGDFSPPANAPATLGEPIK